MAFEPDFYDNQALAPLSTLSTLKHIPFSFLRKVSPVFPSSSMLIDTTQLPLPHTSKKSLQLPNIPVFNVLPNHLHSRTFQTKLFQEWICMQFLQELSRKGYTR